MRWKSIVPNYNTTDFTYNKNDGYYYYKKVLKKGETTPSLFTTVTISKNIPQDEIRKFDIIVYQESYQSYGFDSYQAAWDHYHRNQKNFYYIFFNSNTNFCI